MSRWPRSSRAAARPRAYVCPQRHVRRQGEALDTYIDLIVLGVLSKPDSSESRLGADSGVDVARLHAQKAALQARKDELAALFAEGAVTGAQLKRGTAKLSNAVQSLDAELAAATQGNPVAALVDGSSHVGEKLEKRWATTSPDIRGKVINQLLTVTVNRSPLGLRRFDPTYIDVAWKGDTPKT